MQSRGSPRLFAKWTAAAIVAGALERKVWITTAKGILYPNMYTFLVGEPGVGKTIQTDMAWNLWNGLQGPGPDTHCVAVSSVNYASIVDELREAKRELVKHKEKPSFIEFNSLLVAINDLPTLMPAHDVTMLGVLTDLYDCKVYGQRRRTKDLKFELTSPQINLLAAVTPATLYRLLPEGAWNEGFISRTMLVYSGEEERRSLWDIPAEHDSLLQLLKKDLYTIGHLYGRATFTPDAAAAIDTWHEGGGKPTPSHPRLMHYNTRRTAHLLKLCMVVAAARHDELIIDIEDYGEAMEMLLANEAQLPEIFKSAQSGGDHEVMKETYHFVYDAYMTTDPPVPVAELRIVKFISEKAPSYLVMKILEMMVKGGWLKEEFQNKVGKVYRPQPLKEL